MQPMTLSSVVLPEPDGPSRATTSPGSTSIETFAQRIDARLALAEMLGDAADPHERHAACAVCPCQPPSAVAGSTLQRGAHAKPARHKADDEHDAAEHQHIVGLQHDAAREDNP